MAFEVRGSGTRRGSATRTKKLGPVSITFHKPRVSRSTGGWALFSAVCGLAATLVDTVQLVVVGLVCLGMALVTVFAGPAAGVQTRRASTERKPIPGNKPATTRSTRKPRTTGAKKPAAATKKVGCTIACRRSIKSKDDCDCSCGGQLHGKAAPTRADVASPEMRKREREAVRTQRAAKRKAKTSP